MSKREEKYQRTPDALTDPDMRKMWIFVWCFFFLFKGLTFLKKTGFLILHVGISSSLG